MGILGGRRAIFLPALIAVVFYWPSQSYWQSDDFFAVSYAAILENVLHDFVGPQYSLPPVVRFYRPLITFSFGIDVAFFGPDPFGAHLQNTLVHGLNAMLVFALAWRVAGRRFALPAAVLWALAPSHAGSVLWSVGRVDTHSAFWYLLGLMVCVTKAEKGIGRRFLLVVLVLGLMTKEVMITFPVAAFVLVFALSKRHLSTAARETWPLFVVLAAYWLVRRATLGAWVGGYVGPTLAGSGVAEMAGNLAADAFRVAFDLLNPLSTAFGPAGGDHVVWSAAGGGVAGACLVLGARRLGLGRTALCLGLVVVLGLPVVGFLKGHTDVNTLRYYYLPVFPLLLIAAGAPRALVLALLAAFLVPLSIVRFGEYPRAFREIASKHRAALAVQPLLDPAERALFAGLDHMVGHCIAFHEGADAILDHPFGTGIHRANPFRPVVVHSRVRTLAPGDIGYPLKNLFVWAPGEDGGTYVRAQPPGATPRFEASFSGPDRIGERFLTQVAEGKASAGFACKGTRAPAFRLTLFTGQGYMTVPLPDRAGAGSADGLVDFREFMLAPLYTGEEEPSLPVLEGLFLAVGVDREKVFPLLIEALDDRGAVAASATELLALDFDESYVTWYLRPTPPGPGWVLPGACLVAAFLLCVAGRRLAR